MLVFDMFQVLRQFIIDQCAAAIPPLTTQPIVFLDIPPTDAIQNLARGGPPLIGIFDRHMSKNTTRWTLFSLTPVLGVPQIASTISGDGLLFPGGQQTITIGPNLNVMPTPTAPAVGDAVSAIITSGVNTYSTAVSAVLGDTFNILAAKLVVAINASMTMNQFVSATSVGPVITIQSIGQIGQQVSSMCGAAGTQITEWAREQHSVQIDLMCQTYQDRAAIGSILLGQFAKVQAQFGLMQPDGTWFRLKLNSNMPSRDTHPNDIYRWIFLLDCELGLTTQDAVYSAIQPGIVKVLHY